ncbi:hypothetical protein AK830_g9938 [Neonectria ditissima]|uniref:non-specific serine/threonine protein kinase n=1 Tax=Neonectria ditissima TaxID=78410 RepID=A0A0N8H5N2_9HYPO|nr:hypothetical protein AK830_g9938 [Neonectria ditissima]
MDHARALLGDTRNKSRTARFELVKELEDNVWIATRKGDPRREQYLARPFKSYKPRGDKGSEDSPWQKLLFRQNQAIALGTLLNHENIINIVGEIDRHPFTRTQEKDKGPGKTETYLVFDFCDAANLSTLFADYPVHYSSFYLPESLCWHVLRSLSRAVTYLHDGKRLKPGTVLSSTELPEFVSVDEDWLPILHRAIEPSNIFFQHPRGIETYGQCKLGDFANATVTCHSVSLTMTATASGNIAKAPFRGNEPMEETSKKLNQDPEDLPGDDRPYTLATELWSIGAVIFTMMTGKLLTFCCDKCGCAHIERCEEQGCLENQAYAAGCKCVYGGCEHMPAEGCEEPYSPWKPCPPEHRCRVPMINIDTYVARCGYTRILRKAVLDLLHHNPKTEPTRFRTCSGRAQVIEKEYQRWKETTEEGEEYRDIEDDLDERWGVA